MNIEQIVKPLLWVSSSKKDLMEMPEDVILTLDMDYIKLNLESIQILVKHYQVLEVQV